MNQWHKGKLIGLSRSEIKDQVHKGSKAEFISYRYSGNDRGYGETSIRISLGKDRSISFSDELGDGFVYLHPEQAKHLKRILEIKDFRNIRGFLEMKQTYQKSKK